MRLLLITLVIALPASAIAYVPVTCLNGRICHVTSTRYCEWCTAACEDGSWAGEGDVCPPSTIGSDRAAQTVAEREARGASAREAMAKRAERDAGRAPVPARSIQRVAAPPRELESLTNSQPKIDQAAEKQTYYIATVILTVLSLCLYFFPTFVANHRRHHQQAAIFVTNLLLGWTGLGWAAALIWAVTVAKKDAE